MKASIRTFLVQEDGVTALEYGILAAVIAGVLVVAAKAGLNDMFSTLFAKLKSLVNTAGGGTAPTDPA